MPPLSPGAALRYDTSFVTNFNGTADDFDPTAEASFTAYLSETLGVSKSQISHASQFIAPRRLSEGVLAVSTTVVTGSPQEASDVEKRMRAQVTLEEITTATGVQAVDTSDPSTAMLVISLVLLSPPPSATPPPPASSPPPPLVPAGLAQGEIFALAFGIGFGVIFCVLFVALAVFLIRRRRHQRAAAKYDADGAQHGMRSNYYPDNHLNDIEIAENSAQHRDRSRDGLPQSTLDSLSEKPSPNGISEAERIRRNRAAADAAAAAALQEEDELATPGLRNHRDEFMAV